MNVINFDKTVVIGFLKDDDNSCANDNGTCFVKELKKKAKSRKVSTSKHGYEVKIVTVNSYEMALNLREEIYEKEPYTSVALFDDPTKYAKFLHMLNTKVFPSDA